MTLLEERIERAEQRLKSRRRRFVVPHLRLRVRVLRKARERVEYTSEEYAELTADLLVARKRLDQAQDRSRELKAKLRRLLRRLARQQEAGKVISRGEWGAAPARGSYVRNTAISRRVLHHTAGPLPPASASIATEAAEMRSIQRQHQGQGWTDIGYHRVVMPSGRIYEGRPGWAVGAHVLNANTGTVGVSCAGNYEIAKPTTALVAGAKKAFTGLPGPSAPLVGHYQLNATACPGRNLKPKIGAIA